MLSTLTEPAALAVGFAVPGLGIGWARSALRARSWRQAARTDSLTGLGNRDALALAVSRISRRAPAIGLLMLDLDGFKAINDRHGHPEGDAVLQHVAGALRSAAHPGEVPIRLSGDEFAVLLGAVPAWDAGIELASTRAAAIAAAIARPLGTPRGDITPTATVGAAVLPTERANTGALLRAADQAMYRGKPSGRRAAGSGVAA